MNTYTVTTPARSEAIVEADDFDTVNGLLIFRDEIGRAVVCMALEDGLRVDVEYGDDPRFPLRERLAELQRGENVAMLEDEISRIETPLNRAQRRAGG